MIESGQSLVDQYAAAFSRAGGEPEICEGVIWARAVTAEIATVTADEIISQIARKIEGGTADHGWLLGIIKLLWSDLSEGQRLEIIASLIKGGAHKGLLNSRVFAVPFTDREKAALRDAFKKSRSEAALRRLDG